MHTLLPRTSTFPSKSSRNVSACFAWSTGASANTIPGMHIHIPQRLLYHDSETNHFTSEWKARNVTMICTAILAVDAGLQGLLVWLMRRGYHEKHLEWPMTLVGSLAFVLLISGYIPIPFELVKRRGRVVGIDLWFLTIDWLGAFFSLMSLGMYGSSTSF